MPISIAVIVFAMDCERKRSESVRAYDNAHKEIVSSFAIKSPVVGFGPDIFDREPVRFEIVEDGGSRPLELQGSPRV